MQVENRHAVPKASPQATAQRRVDQLTWGSFAVFLAPTLLIVGAFIFYPLFSAAFLSFFNWDGISIDRTFVGLQNYRTLFFEDPVFWRALTNTGIWVVLSLVIPTSLGLALAMALNTKIFGQATFRAIFYIPAIIASIAVATIWSWMYHPSLGFINSVFELFGSQNPPDWLGDRNIALYSVFVAHIWVAVGPNMILFLAGLQTIPGDLIDAAKVDGANRVQVFRNVILPSLRQISVVVIALTIIGSLKVFDLIYSMTFGGPGQATQVLASWSYFQAFNTRNFGMGMAVAVVLLFITLLIVIPYLLWSSKED